MPVNNDQFQVTPYTSTVPLVNIPPDQMQAQTTPAAPLQGQFGGGKGQAKLAIGDSLLKGFMAGHEEKQQRKTQQAQTAIAAADGMRESAYQNYQQNLQNLGPQPDQSDPKYTQWKKQADGFYSDYSGVVQKSREAIAPYVIPEKQPKGQQKKGVKGEIKTGWNNFKDFFEANPQIVPQLGLMAIQPKPPGLAPAAQTQSLDLRTAQVTNEQKERQLENDKTYQEGYAAFSPLTPEQVDRYSTGPMGGQWRSRYDAWKNAEASQQTRRGTQREYVSPDGQYRDWYYPDEKPAGWNATGGTAGQPKEGTVEDFTANALKGWGVDANTPPATKAAAEKLAHDWWNWKQAQTSTSTSGSIQDVSGDRSTTSTVTRGAKEPQAKDYGLPDTFKMQQGFQPPPSGSQQAAPAAGGFPSPPTAGAAPTGQKAQGMPAPPQAGKTTKAGMAPPPGGKQTALTASVTRQATAAQQKGYQTAENDWAKANHQADLDYDKAIKDGVDPAKADLDRQDAKNQALAAREEAKKKVAAAYDAAVTSIGGTPGGQQQGPIAVQAPDGNTYTFPDQDTADAFRSAAGIK